MTAPPIMRTSFLFLSIGVDGAFASAPSSSLTGKLGLIASLETTGFGVGIGAGFGAGAPTAGAERETGASALPDFGMGGG